MDGLKTLVFAGSDKNAGKTTALGIFLNVFRKIPADFPVILTSIGINGENFDQWEGHEKPAISVFSGEFVLTKRKWLQKHSSKWILIHSEEDFLPSTSLVLARVVLPFEIILEGPNTSEDLFAFKSFIQNTFKKALLIADGSIDRNFLSRPDFCDGFFFSLLVDSREYTKRKALFFLKTLTLKTVTKTQKEKITSLEVNTRWAFLSENPIKSYSSKNPALLDTEFTKILSDHENTGILYLNGALTGEIAKKIDFSRFIVILKNHTLYQCFPKEGDHYFFPALVLEQINLLCVFLNQKDHTKNPLPSSIPTLNLFREDLHETTVKAWLSRL